MPKRQKWLLGAGLTVMGCATAAGVQLLHRNATSGGSAESSCVRQIALGWRHTCLLFRNGRVHCFGNTSSTGTGDIEAPPDRDPIRTEERFSSIAAGHETCGISAKDASVWCWGPGSRRGFRQPTPTGVPERFDALGTDNVQVSPAADRVCAVKRDGSLWCQRFDPYPPERILEGAHQVFTSNYFACAKMRDETVQCWGNNDSGQLGRGTTGNAGLGVWGEPPAPISGGGRELQTLYLIGNAACGITAAHAVWCWGSADFSAFGDGRYYDGTNAANIIVTRPQELTLPFKVKDYQLGLALAQDGSVWNWGGENPLLENPVTVARGGGKAVLVLRPQRLNQLGHDNERVFRGSHACAQKRDGSLWCWGDNSGRQVSRKELSDSAGLHEFSITCPAD